MEVLVDGASAEESDVPRISFFMSIVFIFVCLMIAGLEYTILPVTFIVIFSYVVFDV